MTLLFLSGSDCHIIGLDRIDDHMTTPVGYLIYAILHIASDLQI